MPELPEVEIMVRDLSQGVLGCTVIAAETYWDRMVVHPTPDEFRRRLVGRTIAGLQRRGKYAIFELDDGELLIVHRGMSGSLLRRPVDAPDDRFVRARFVLDDGTELRLDDSRKFGKLFLIDPEREDVPLPWARMGPEPLDEALTPEAFRLLFTGRTAPVKALLLNQNVLAGVGNIYADEALFAARIHPTRRAHTLSGAELERLHEAVRAVLAAGIAERGTTFSSARDLEGRNGRYQQSLRVFRRGGQPCPRCGSPIEKMVVAGRGTHVCPRCQA